MERGRGRGGGAAVAVEAWREGEGEQRKNVVRECTARTRQLGEELHEHLLMEQQLLRDLNVLEAKMQIQDEQHSELEAHETAAPEQSAAASAPAPAGPYMGKTAVAAEAAELGVVAADCGR